MSSYVTVMCSGMLSVNFIFIVETCQSLEIKCCTKSELYTIIQIYADYTVWYITILLDGEKWKDVLDLSEINLILKY